MGGRSFWPAVGWSMLPIALTHFPIILAAGPAIGFGAMLAAAVTSIPLSRLDVLGGHTLWATALPHASIDSFKLIVLPAAALDTAPALAPFALAQAKTRAAVAEAEVLVVAELARVPVPLSRLASMKVGDVIRLPVSIDAPARLRVGGHAVHAGRPTTSGAQIAIAIERHGD